MLEEDWLDKTNKSHQHNAALAEKSQRSKK